MISYEDVVAGLERDLLGFSCQLGGVNGGRFSAGNFPEMISIGIKVDRDAELKKYNQAVTWLSSLLFRQNFQSERVKAIVQKILNGIDSVKRSGRAVVNATHLKFILTPTSNSYQSLVLNQEKILKEVSQLLVSDPTKVLKLVLKEPMVRFRL